MKLFVGIFMALLIAQSACVRAQVAIPYSVELTLHPPGNPTEVRLPPAKGWGAGGKKNGYVGYDKDQYGDITFELNDQGQYKANNKCPPAGDAAWVITQIGLSASGDYPAEKGDRFGKPQDQDPWLQKAFPDVVMNTGLIFPTAANPTASTTVKIHDANEQNGQRFIFYEVTVTNCANSALKLKTDPGFGNRGK